MEITHNTNQSSIELEKNSKGVKWSVKAYADTDECLAKKLDTLVLTAKKKTEQILLEEI